MRSNCSKALLILAAGLALAAPSLADSITFTGTNGSNLSATATFTTSGSNLIVTLTNTSTVAVPDPAAILTAVFFTLGGNPTLTRVSAILGPGSTVLYGPTNGGNVGGEWAYISGLSGAPLGASSGISSTGMNLFGSGNFNGPNLQGPASVDGLQYGILSAGGNNGGNAAVTGKFALIQNQVIFTLTGLPTGYSLTGNVTNVNFQYGTALTEPNNPGRTPVPEPGSLVLLGTGLLGLATIVRRKLSL